MQLTINDHQVEHLLHDHISETNKTALNLFNYRQVDNNTALEEHQKSIIKISSDNNTRDLLIQGLSSPAKIYASSGKLIRICSAKNGKAKFNLAGFKKGQYVLEVERTLIEFVI